MRRVLQVRRHRVRGRRDHRGRGGGAQHPGGIVVAVVASIIDHLRHSYRPRNSVLVKSAAGHWQTMPVTPGARTEPGAGHLPLRHQPVLRERLPAAGRPHRDQPPRAARSAGSSWTARPSATWTTPPPRSSAAPIAQLHQRHIQFVMTSVLTPVRQQLEHYGISGAAGPDAYFDTPGQALEAFLAAQPARSRPRRQAGLPGRPADQPAARPGRTRCRTRSANHPGPGADPDSVTVSPSAR